MLTCYTEQSGLELAAIILPPGLSTGNARMCNHTEPKQCAADTQVMSWWLGKNSLRSTSVPVGRNEIEDRMGQRELDPPLPQAQDDES